MEVLCGWWDCLGSECAILELAENTGEIQAKLEGILQCMPNANE